MNDISGFNASHAMQYAQASAQYQAQMREHGDHIIRAAAKLNGAGLQGASAAGVDELSRLVSSAIDDVNHANAEITRANDNFGASLTQSDKAFGARIGGV